MGDTATSVVSLSEITWPTPPPSPPLLPPRPPPERRLNATADQLECQFEQGIDLSVSSSAQRNPSAAHSVDNPRQCCALCALKASCNRFVFIPGSGVCVLLPHVPKLELVRISNPATVAGTVFLARSELSAPARPHASCTFEVGYGYAKGALGAGRPLDEPQITSQQACCDACERNAECVKFVFEKYGGGCQLFEAFSERYRTPGLIAGQITARLALGYSTATATTSQDGIAPSPPPPFDESPAPPTLGFAMAMPPPMPPPDEGGAAEAVLAYFSIAMGGFMVVGLMLCTYCFYFGEIQGLLHQWTRGRYGKAKFSLLPKSLQELERAGTVPPDALPGRKRKKKKELMLLGHKGPPEGHCSVTCETAHVSQKKHVHVAECASLEELLDRVWEEFGHVLKSVRQRDTALMCWVPTAAPDTSQGEWQLLTKTSDIAQATAGHALKLVEKQLVADLEARPVAFQLLLPDKRRKTAGRVANGDAEHPPVPAAVPAAEPEAATAPSLPVGAVQMAAALNGGTEHQPVEVEPKKEEQDDEDDDEEEEEPRGRGRSVRAVEGWSDEGPGSAVARPTTDATDEVFLQQMMSWSVQRQVSRSSALDDVTDLVAEMDGQRTSGALQTAAASVDDADLLVGARVRIHGLQSMGELNGRTGVVVAFDGGKGRYRVRFEAESDDDVERPRVMAFKASNLEACNA